MQEFSKFARAALEKFDEATKQNRFSIIREHYLETLKEMPWKKCSCPICQKIGVEVIIFRGNNRTEGEVSITFGYFTKFSKTQPVGFLGPASNKSFKR